MAVVNECSESLILTDEHGVKNNQESSDTPVQPGGDSLNNSSVLKSSGNENVDTDQCERRKKTRRGKPKRKNPYNKEGNETRKAVNRSKNRPRFIPRHADAPYNTNEFLMEDHNDFVKIDSPATVQPDILKSRPPRVRDPSFTSVDSDEDHFYSSPEDEEEFLTKEFSNTYQDLHVETLQGMSKSELVQQVLQLEEKVDGLEKRLHNKPKNERDICEKSKISLDEIEDDYGDDDNDATPTDKVKLLQIEIGRLRLENEKLQMENDRLRRRRTRSSSVSSVDSESDSTGTTSSPSSVSSLSDKEELLESNITEDMDYLRENITKTVAESNQIDVAMQEQEHI